MRLLRFARPLFAAAVLVAVGLAACGGGSSLPTLSPAGSTTPSVAASAGGSVAAQLEALGSEWAKTPAKIAYQYSSGATGGGNLGAFTLYWKPPKAWRMDLAIGGATTILISTEKQGYVCNAGSGGSGGNCVSVAPSSASAPVPFLGTFTDPNALQSEISQHVSGVDVSTSSQTIAGQDATCYSVTGSASGEQATTQWCFSQDGLLLLYQVTASGTAAAGTFKLEATSVSRDVSDADFEPPYDVATGNAAGNGTGNGTAYRPGCFAYCPSPPARP